MHRDLRLVGKSRSLNRPLGGRVGRDTAGTGSCGCSEQGYHTLTGFPEEGNFDRQTCGESGVGVRDGRENVLGTWNCLLEGTGVKRMSSWQNKLKL